MGTNPSGCGCDFTMNRRAFLNTCAGSLGTVALAYLLAADGKEAIAASGRGRDPLAPRLPHHPPRARSVISLFQHGGPSQVDLFDPKPELNRRHGKDYPGALEVHFEKQVGKLMGSPFTFPRRGRSGMEISEILPGIGSIADDITLVRSMTTESVDHEAALRLIHTGKIFADRPTIGSWAIYGLGTECRNLPAYVVLADPGGLPIDGVRNWSSGWLPAVYQGTVFRSTGSPVHNLKTPEGIPGEARGAQLRLLERLNEAHLARHPENSELQARISNYELAARMQLSVGEAMDLASEPEETRRLYGLDRPETAEYAKRCLMARRLVERGVRFVQIFLGGQPWDTHDKNAEKLKALCARYDRPAAALVRDLKRRGLLDTTVVLWTGEFGRLPVSQGGDGRDHNRHAFSLWLAGGGFKGGYAHGATDEFGYRAVKDPVTVSDLHATLLWTLGIDHARLSYLHESREETLTDPPVTGARVVRELLA